MAFIPLIITARHMILFHPDGACELLAAFHEGEVLAALMVFVAGKRAWYLYGASGNQKRHLMPTYLLQWEAMLWAKNQGCIQLRPVGSARSG